VPDLELLLTNQEPRDHEPADDEKHVDADESASQVLDVGMCEDYENYRESSQALNVRSKRRTLVARRGCERCIEI
jgi:hypothetical protein